MGQRANLILVEGGAYRLFYNHWCANTLPTDLFWGPDHAVRFVRCQREVDESGWLNDIWAEGAAVIDLEKRTFLLFGGEDILHDVPLRRVYLEMLGRVWKDWHIHWAYEGIATVADYVGYPRSNVLTVRSEETATALDPPEQREWTDLVASIRWAADQLRLYPLAGDVRSYLLGGPGLLKSAEKEGGHDHLNLEEWTTTFPNGGLHIDVTTQTVEFWTARDAPAILPMSAERWCGWNVQWHRDGYEIQLERTSSRLRLPSPSRESLEQRVAAILLAAPMRSMVEIVERIAKETRVDGKTARVEINPLALLDDRLEVNLEVRREILARALGRRVDG